MRWIKFFLFLLIAGTIANVVVEAKTIHEYLMDVDKFYFVTLGKNSKGSDVFAASDIINGLRRNVPAKPMLTAAIETEISPKSVKILVGNPCDNNYTATIFFECGEWPYDAGEAVIIVKDFDLVIAGTTEDDTRRASLVVANFKDFPVLKQEYAVLVKGTTMDRESFIVEHLKRENEYVCGDNKCEPGERPLCYIDCQKISCFQLCVNKGFNDAICVDEPSNPNVEACLDAENYGKGYCATGKVCCCKQKQIVEEIKPKPLPVIANEIRKSFFSRLFERIRIILAQFF